MDPKTAVELGSSLSHSQEPNLTVQQLNKRSRRRSWKNMVGDTVMCVPMSLDPKVGPKDMCLVPNPTEQVCRGTTIQLGTTQDLSLPEALLIGLSTMESIVNPATPCDLAPI